ncbi:MAG TPA: hypothetical protein VMM77_02060 [Gemmatimonadaceae bacterium]|nr:hypothetical protein [Gemmatimonadaceae bacterium]
MTILRKAMIAVFQAVLALTAASAQGTVDSIPDSLLAPVFREHSALPVTLVTAMRQLTRDRRGEPEWQPAVLRFGGAASDSLEAEVRARGLFRRNKCAVPPLRIDIPRKRAETTPLGGLNKFKLVVHCENNDTYEQYVVQEYLIYRVYNLLTPFSQHARLLRMTYVDSSSPADSVMRYAILLEEDEDVARRTGTALVALTGAGPYDVDSYQSALVGVFQYMIGNTDWSIAGLHNVKLFQRLLETFPMAYDFDFSGAVHARYATVDSRLPIRSVRDRLFRGYCTEEDKWQEVYALFRARREAITALYVNEPALDAKVRDRTLGYFNEFFAILDDPARADRMLARACRK